MAEDSTRPWFSEQRLRVLKEKYSVEMKDADDNPIKTCMRLIFEAATQRDLNKRNLISLKLSQFLIHKDGLVNLFLALIDFDISSQKSTTHNQRFLAVANIITCLPKLCVPYEEYSSNISHQLIPLLIHPIAEYSTLASIIMKALIESPHTIQLQKKSGNDETISNVILNSILKPLTMQCNSSCDLDISNSITAIHTLLKNRFPAKLFIQAFPNLICCLLTLHTTSSHLKSYLKNSLVKILDHLKPGPACCLLEQTIFYDANKSNNYRVMAKDDEVSLEWSDGSELDTNLLDALAIELLDACNNDLLSLEFFFHFQSRMWTCEIGTNIQRYANLIQPLLMRTNEGNSIDNKSDLFTSMATNSQRSFELISRTLSNYLEFLQNYDQEDKPNEKSQNTAYDSLLSCINILEVLRSITRFENDDIKLDNLIPVLEEIRLCLTNRSNENARKLRSNIESLLERFKTSDDAHPSGANSTGRGSEHDQISRDLNDKLVPNRVHALIRLRQLLMANKGNANELIEQFYFRVESSLADQESYVFLASINLMAEMGIRSTDLVLPRLMELHRNEDVSIQQRINVGEVLARMSRRLNQTAPHYASLIMDGLLENGGGDANELIRMSSLTNIGFIAANLGYSLRTYITDILICVERILNNDTIQVKCAAVDLLRTTLAGLTNDEMKAAESIQADLGPIYKTLKRLKTTALDEKLWLHVSLAMDEIDRLARAMLGVADDSRQTRELLTKNIKVRSLLN